MLSKRFKNAKNALSNKDYLLYKGESLRVFDRLKNRNLDTESKEEIIGEYNAVEAIMEGFKGADYGKIDVLDAVYQKSRSIHYLRSNELSIS